MKRIQDLADLKGKKVFVRANYNVPMDDRKIVDNERIIASLETINFLLEKEATVVLVSHLGRPEGNVVPELSLKPIAKELEKLINKSVLFVENCVGDDRDKAVAGAKSGDVLLLENTRFHEEEMLNDALFAQKLSRNCDIYINDAFPDSHRAHASVVGVATYLPASAGFALQREVDSLSRLVSGAEKPFVFISGGAKVSDKLGILDNMLDKIDTLLIGGGMANTFLCSQNVEIGCSLYEEEYVKEANQIIVDARMKCVKLVLPRDVIVTKAIAENARGIAIATEEVGDLDIIVDLGPVTIADFEREIASAKTIFWNGSLGIAEYPNFAKATQQVGAAIARSKAFSAIGGGDTIAALSDEVKNKFSFVSMAGGASMEFLEGKVLPGLAILEVKQPLTSS
jgi:3-phosphoglycerate kinase